MDEIERQERKREARRRLNARRRRVVQLRGRVVAISLIGFVLLWGVVFAQMATGNDPVLAGKRTTAPASTAGKRHRPQARELPDEEGSTDTEEAEAEQAAELEAAVSAEAAEVELLEAEAEVEPEPVTTSQS